MNQIKYWLHFGKGIVSYMWGEHRGEQWKHKGTDGRRMVRTGKWGMRRGNQDELCINIYLGCYDLASQGKCIIKSDNGSCLIWKKTWYMIWRANSLCGNMGTGMIER